MRFQIRRVAIVAVLCMAALPLWSGTATAGGPAGLDESVTSPQVTWTQDEVTDALVSLMKRRGASDLVSAWHVEAGVPHVAVPALDADLIKEIKDRVGAAVVITQRDQPEQAYGVKSTLALASEYLLNPRARAASAAAAATRTADTSPYKAGDRITRPSGQPNQVIICTSGGKVRSNSGSGPAYMFMAGHCGPTQTVWTQGGTSFSTQWGDNKIDGALLGGKSYSPLIWGPNNTLINTTGTVPDALYGQVSGVGMCASGATTGWTCGNNNLVSTQKYTECVNYTGGTRVCNLRWAYYSGAVVVRGGDSGGPILRNLSSGRYHWAGVISGEGDGGHRLYFSPEAQLLDTFAVSRMTT